MESNQLRPHERIVQKLKSPKSFMHVLIVVLVVSLLAGVGTGFVLANNSSGSGVASSVTNKVAPPKSAIQDTKTFKDFAEGKVQKKPAPKKGDNYSEGTHLLIRVNAVPVTLTSSVVDLVPFEGKQVKVYGETQKAIEEGWLMDVGRVEVK